MSFSQVYDDCVKRKSLFTDINFPCNSLSLTKGMTIDLRNDSNSELNKCEIILYDQRLLLQSNGITNKEPLKHNNIEENNKNLTNQWTKIKWKRIHEFNLSPMLFPKDKSLNPLDSCINLIDGFKYKLGLIKNENLLSAILATAEDANRITQLFTTDKLNSQGVYEIKLCKEGYWNYLLIDDYLPCFYNTEELCFTNCTKNDNVYFWIMLLEKAFAKLYGSYCLLEKLSIEDVLYNLTGSYPKILFNTCNDLWSNIKNENSYCSIILAKSDNNLGSKMLLKEIGLDPNKSYCILTTQKVEVNDYIENIVKIRSCAKEINCTGDWCKNSNFWKEDIKDLLNYDEDDKSFWMNLRDLKHYFTKFYICKIIEKSSLNSIKINQDKNKYNIIKISLIKPQGSSDIDNEICKLSYNIDTPSQITLIQKNKLEIFSQNYSYSLGRFLLCKIEKDEQNNEKLIYLQGTLGNGNIISKDYYLSQ